MNGVKQANGNIVNLAVAYQSNLTGKAAQDPNAKPTLDVSPFSYIERPESLSSCSRDEFFIGEGESKVKAVLNTCNKEGVEFAQPDLNAGMIGLWADRTGNREKPTSLADMTNLYLALPDSKNVYKGSSSEKAFIPGERLIFTRTGGSTGNPDTNGDGIPDGVDVHVPAEVVFMQAPLEIFADKDLPTQYTGGDLTVTWKSGQPPSEIDHETRALAEVNIFSPPRPGKSNEYILTIQVPVVNDRFTIPSDVMEKLPNGNYKLSVQPASEKWVEHFNSKAGLPQQDIYYVSGSTSLASDLSIENPNTTQRLEAVIVPPAPVPAGEAN